MSTVTGGGTAERPRRGSPWSIQLARIAGIPLRIHFTFFLFLGWIWLQSQKSGMVWGPLLIVAIFACVVLHEFGHALTARRYGIQTRDITLYPIGGVAMLQGRPKPAQELWIALAGPAVNVAIALLLIPVSLALTGRPPMFAMSQPNMSFVDGLFTANVWLPLFNMIPAFPMDGGRVLRALLGLSMPEARATQIAATIGQVLAMGFGLFALFSQGSFLWLLIAFFVYMGAAQEAEASLSYSLVEGRRVRDAMQVRYRVIQSGESLDTAARMLLDGSQHDFPVVAGDEVIGMLSRTAIARGLANEGPGGYVAGQMNREFRRLVPDEPLERAMELFSQGDSDPIVVMEGDRLVGMLTGENLSEFIMLEHARTQRRSYATVG